MSGPGRDSSRPLPENISRHIKRFPEDFIVEEVLDLQSEPEGPYSYYLLTKKNHSTLEVLDILSRKLRIPRYKFGLSGLKDRRAVTTQYISIEGGPPEDIKGRNWHLKFHGFGTKGIRIGQARGNRFTITLRDIDPKKVKEAMEFIALEGFANYFGIQRFSPDLYTKTPIAKLLIEGHTEQALKEYLTQRPDPEQSKSLKALWSRWDMLLRKAAHLSHQEKNAFRVLLRGESFERAFRVLPKQIKLLFFFSYQSRLWNRLLRRLISRAKKTFSAPFPVEGQLLFYKAPDRVVEALRKITLPFVSSEVMQLDLPPWLRDEFIKLLREEALEDRLQAEVHGLKVFNPGFRAPIASVQEFEILEVARRKLIVRFFLNSGCYATVLLLKALYY